MKRYYIIFLMFLILIPNIYLINLALKNLEYMDFIMWYLMFISISCSCFIEYIMLKIIFLKRKEVMNK